MSKIDFDFRGSLAFVTGPADEVFVHLFYDYPRFDATGNFGWETEPTNTVDINNTVDARLAGIGYVPNDGTRGIFRHDLPAAGAYLIGLAAGSAQTGAGTLTFNHYVEIYDNTTLLATITGTTVVSNDGSTMQFLDAAGNVRTKTTWPAGQTYVRFNFATTVLRVKIGSPTVTTDDSVLTNLSVQEAPPVVTTIGIGGDNQTLLINTDEDVSIGAGGNGGVALTASGGAVTATYSSGSGTTQLRYSMSRVIGGAETVTCTYTQPGNGIEATSGGVDLASFSGTSVGRVPAAPTGVDVTNATATGAQLDYDPITDVTVDTLTVEIYTDDTFASPTDYVIAVGATTLTFTSALSAGQTYSLRMIATNEFGDSDWSSTAHFTVTDAPTRHKRLIILRRPRRRR